MVEITFNPDAEVVPGVKMSVEEGFIELSMDIL